MTTECNQKSFAVHYLGRRQVIAQFDGGLLLRETERLTGSFGQGDNTCGPVTVRRRSAE